MLNIGKHGKILFKSPDIKSNKTLAHIFILTKYQLHMNHGHFWNTISENCLERSESYVWQDQKKSGSVKSWFSKTC